MRPHQIPPDRLTCPWDSGPRRRAFIPAPHLRVRRGCLCVLGLDAWATLRRRGRDRWLDNVSWDEAARPLSPALLLWSLLFPEMACFTVSEIHRCLLTFACLSLCPPPPVCNWNRTLSSGISPGPASSARTCLLFPVEGGVGGVPRSRGFGGWLISNR